MIISFKIFVLVIFVSTHHRKKIPLFSSFLSIRLSSCNKKYFSPGLEEITLNLCTFLPRKSWLYQIIWKTVVQHDRQKSGNKSQRMCCECCITNAKTHPHPLTTFLHIKIPLQTSVTRKQLSVTLESQSISCSI